MREFGRVIVFDSSSFPVGVVVLLKPVSVTTWVFVVPVNLKRANHRAAVGSVVVASLTPA